MKGTKPFEILTRDASSTNITTSFSEMDADVAQDVAGIIIATTTLVGMYTIGVGPSGSEASYFSHSIGSSVGVTTTYLPIVIQKGMRLSIKVATGTISSGLFQITLLH